MPRNRTERPVGRSKYGAVRTNGYASKKEAEMGANLEILERAGKISNLNKQVSYTLLPADKEAGYPRPLRYVSDFTWLEDGRVVVCRCEGIFDARLPD